MIIQKRLSLKTKLVFFSALLVMFVAATLSYYLRASQKNAIQEEQLRMAEEMVRALRTVTRDGILVNDETLVVNYVNILKKQDFVSSAMVLTPEGRIRIHTNPLLIGQTLTDAASRETLLHAQRNAPLFQIIQDASNAPLLDMALPVYTGPEQHHPAAVVRIAFDQSEIKKRIQELLQNVDRQIMGGVVLALGLGLAGAYLLALFITKPIERLRRGAEIIGEGQLGHRIQVNTRDELNDLADAFNRMGEKLTELDRMKQDFVSNVTHELRSPLTSLRGYIDLLLGGTGGALSPLQKDYLSIVKNNTVRLSRFIDNLLDVAKIEAHKIKLSPEEQNVHTMAHEMEVLFKPQMDEKKIRFVNAVPSEGTVAFVDKDKLAEVLINITSNAIKFTPVEGEVRMTAVEEPTFIRIGVEDTGVGIPPAMVEKVFNKFEQVKRTEGLARDQKGTGLGLAIVKGIIEAHGGRIWVESPAPSGKGTAFYFTVPKLTDELKMRLQGDV